MTYDPGRAITVFAFFQLIHLMINLRQIKNYFYKIKATAKIMSYKIHIFSCIIILANHVSYSYIHLYILSITYNFHLPRAFAWCGALPSDCGICTALHCTCNKHVKSLFFLSNIISVLSNYTLFMSTKPS